MMKFITLVVILLTLSISCKEKNSANGAKNPVANRLESYINDCNKNGLSASILVAQHGDILYSGGVGFRNKTEQLPVTEATVFTTGSLTKQFTATAILQLQEANKLAVSDSIYTFFDNLPKDKQHITIHQLLTHTSGIVGNLGYGVDFKPISKQEFLAKVYNTPLDFASGTQYSYSNVGYSLLAMIIEKVTLLEYESYLQRHLFQKAGMKHTGYLLPKWDTTQVAHGYKCGEDWGTHFYKWKAATNKISWHLKGNGGILSTSSDLYQWYLAVKNQKVISKKSWEQLTFPHVKENESGDSYYGYGWTLMNSDRNTKIIAHNGSNGVFYADLLQLPEENTVIIYMTNELRYDTQLVAWEIEQLLFNENYTPVVPKMNPTKHIDSETGNKQLQIVHQFVQLITDEDVNSDQLITNHLTNKQRTPQFKMWIKAMQKEFSGYSLKHILAYEDMSYDIVLESKDGKVVDLTPCFDLQFNEHNKLVAFGW